MKRYLIAAAAVSLIAMAALHAFAADDLPKAPAFARYEAMMNHSPFAVATAPAPAPAATPNFAKDLYIANAAHTADGDLVTVASSTDKNFKKYLSTKTTVDGYSVPSVEWSDRVGATKVTISKDGQFATLTFNQALLTAPVTNQPAAGPVPQVPTTAQVQQINPGAVPPPQPVQPYPVPGSPNTGKAPGVPALPTPPPRTRGVIQRNPNAAAASDTEQLQPPQQVIKPNQ